ncbi:hypothetical protein ACWGE1_39040 [Streptomyces sp. NPDC054932]
MQPFQIKVEVLSWALGGAGVALALGAALVAGTGRRRRTTA